MATTIEGAVAERCAPGASNDYIQARTALLDDELALRHQLEKLAEKRRNLPQGPIMKNYVFTGACATGDENKQLTLADLMTNGRSLVLYALMFAPEDEEPCSMCSGLVDGLNSAEPHVKQNANFFLVAKAPIDKIKAYAIKRGWTNIRLLSSYDNDFNLDMHTEDPVDKDDRDAKGHAKVGQQQPAIIVFKKDDDGNVRHVYSQGQGFGVIQERGLDLFSPVWNILDIIPEGRGNFYTGNQYIKAA